MVVFLCFGSYILKYNLISRALTKAAIEKSLEIANSDNQQTSEAAAYYLSQKRASFFAFFYKTRANTQQVPPEQTSFTGTMNEWCQILTIKTLTEVNRT